MFYIPCHFNPHNSTVSWGWFISPLPRWEDWFQGMFCDFPQDHKWQNWDWSSNPESCIISDAVGEERTGKRRYKKGLKERRSLGMEKIRENSGQMEERNVCSDGNLAEKRAKSLYYRAYIIVPFGAGRSEQEQSLLTHSFGYSWLFSLEVCGILSPGFPWCVPGAMPGPPYITWSP